MALVAGCTAAELSDGLLGAVGAAEAAERVVGGGRAAGTELARPVLESDRGADNMPVPEG